MLFDKWVGLKIVEFLVCVACLVAKRVSQDDEARLALLLQKLSREWSLLTSVTWDSVGGAFADAVYGGYVIITFVLVVARMFQEIPKGRRILEGCFLGFGMLFFLILGGLELASLDSVPRNLIVNASVLGSLSLIVAALFLIDLMGPRIYTAATQSQTDPSSPKFNKKGLASPKIVKKVSIASPPTTNGTNGTINGTNGTINGTNGFTNGVKNGHLQNGIERPKDLDLEKGKTDGMKEMTLLETAIDEIDGETKLDIENGLVKSKFGSLRSGLEGGNYVRLSDPLSEKDRLHYEKELAKFHDRYFKEFIDNFAGRLPCKEDYLPELQTPVFAKVKTGRLKNIRDEESYEKPSKAKTMPSPTLQQLEDYLRSPNRNKRADTPALFPMEPIEEKETTDTEGRASGTPTDPGYVQYTAGRWPDKARELRTPRHSPT